MNAALQSMLLQLLAAKSGIDPETLTDPGGSAGEIDPRLSLLLNYLNEKQAEQQQQPDDDTSDQEDAPLEPEVLSSPTATEQLRIQRAEIELLRRRCDRLAAALGACYLCWGRDPACVQCLGSGRPGWNEPDETLFRRLVVPAIRRHREGPRPNLRP